jgi:hypothetical protein
VWEGILANSNNMPNVPAWRREVLSTDFGAAVAHKGCRVTPWPYLISMSSLTTTMADSSLIRNKLALLKARRGVSNMSFTFGCYFGAS